MTKYIHSVKAEKFSSNRKIFKSKNLHMLKFGGYHQHGACHMCHDFMGNEIMNNVSQQVMKEEKITQSKELI
jgi:hypothetical protein